MQKTWEKYNEMEVNLKRGEMGTYQTIMADVK